MKQYLVDAFTNKMFSGNQAAVCVMNDWPDDGLMMKIAAENNLSETAFCVKEEAGESPAYSLRWFTPAAEINLCGHATLATAFVLFNEYEEKAKKIRFNTMSGELTVSRKGSEIEMDFPSYELKPVEITDAMEKAFGARPAEAYLDRDLLAVFEDEEIIRNMKPDVNRLKKLQGLCIGVTAPGNDYDCVSRVFAPELALPEDPVTGSTHCMIAPYWAKKLGKSEIRACQASERGGDLNCKVLRGGRVKIAGSAVLFSVAELMI